MIIENPIILNRKNRNFWYVRYQMIFNNTSVKTVEFSTKVSKDEKSFEYMQNVYLPAWIKKEKRKLNPKKEKDTIFLYYAELFLKEYEVHEDFKNMQYRMQRILNDFANKDIKHINKLEIRLWINSLNSRTTSEELSINSKKKYLRIFRGIFELAIENDLIEKNIAKDIQLKKVSKQHYTNSIKPFNLNQVRNLIQTSKNIEYGPLLHYYLGIAFNQGMSPSEIIGLQIEDVDLKSGYLSIKRNITKGKVKSTKTEFRVRTIPIFEPTIHYLKFLIAKAKNKKSIWLFSDKHGNHLEDIKSIRGDNEINKNGKAIKKRSKWYKLLYDCNISYIELKNCRHTFAVRAIESKEFTLQEIANILGHSSLQMLINHYAKWIDKKAMSANKKVDLFSDTLGDTF